MLYFFIVAFLLHFSVAAVWIGTIESDSNFVFIDRFAFADTGNGTDHAPGSLYFSVTPTSEHPALEAKFLTVCLFYDFEWRKQQEAQQCADKEQAARLCEPVQAHGSQHSVSVVDNYGASFWYIAVTKCANEPGNKWSVAYNITALNPGGSQFGVDQEGLVAMYTFWTLAYALLIVVHAKAVIELRRAQSYHVLVKMLTVSLAVEFVVVFFLLCHFAAFGADGKGAPALVGLAEFLDIYVQVVFMMMLLLLAQGWAISHNTIHNRQVLLTSFASLVLAYLILFIWQYTGRDRSSTLYVYESVPGILILVIRGALLVWYLLSLRMSISQEPDVEKRKFFTRFGSTYTLWFSGLLFVVGIGAMTAPVYREKVVWTLYNLLNFAGFACMVVLMWPKWALHYFKIAAPDLLFAGGTPTAYDAI